MRQANSLKDFSELSRKDHLRILLSKPIHMTAVCSIF